MPCLGSCFNAVGPKALSMFNQSDPAVYDAIYDSLIPRLNIREPRRHRIALESTITLCAEHARKRLVPTVAIRVRRVIPRCFAL